jgi:methylenetetrahydrofolate dehydrogenase (NADP+)/methenyltetrahydrofolate cyclohydrolase
MAPHVLNGRKTSKALGAGLRARVAALSRPPGLAVVLVGDDPASAVYVRKKRARAERLGFHQRTERLPATASQAQVEELVAELNADPVVDGILVQLPLPAGLDERRVLALISPEKDVDGFHVLNTGRLAQGEPVLVPCTPLGVMRMLEHADIALSGLDAVVIGRSNIVGRPMAMLLEQANCTVTVCHSRTRGLADHLRRADLIVAAVGRPGTVRAEHVKEGAIVVDVGINRLDDGSLVGDVDYDGVAPRCAAITPVPGGVGPMTISMLMENTVTASERAQA